MPVDVETRIEIDRPRDRVAAYASNPANATDWYQNIKSVEWPAYTYEVRELAPGERLVMSTSDGPFPMQTTYTWEDAGAGRIRMTLRNRGRPAGFSKLTVPLMSTAIRRANRKDLDRLKRRCLVASASS